MQTLALRSKLVNAAERGPGAVDAAELQRLRAQLDEALRSEERLRQQLIEVLRHVLCGRRMLMLPLTLQHIPGHTRYLEAGPDTTAAFHAGEQAGSTASSESAARFTTSSRGTASCI